MSGDYPYEGDTFGDYRLVHGLGRGGFADVYLGTDIMLGKSVAIKVMNTRVPRQQQIDKFKKEARVVAALEHRHIIEVYRYGVEGTIPYVVMKYAPNGSIRSKHPRRTVLPLETSVAYVRQVAEALQYAHDQGLIHRDVKPENMLFGSFGEILLSDFGIAILTETRGGAGPQDIVGTLAYMAPEQFEGKAVRQSDQYALGVVVYEWLVGDVPFHPETIYEAAVQHKSWPVPSMNRSGVTVPCEIEAIVLKALAKDPQDRFESITTFAQALQTTLHYISITPTVGAELWIYGENEAEVLTVAWSSDGSRIITGNSNGTSRIIDSLTCQTSDIHILEKPESFELEGYRKVSSSKSSLDPDGFFRKTFMEWLTASKSAHIAFSHSSNEKEALCITGLEQGTFQRWTTVGAPFHVEEIREYRNIHCNKLSVSITWNTDYKKYLIYDIRPLIKEEYVDSSHVFDFIPHYPHAFALSLLNIFFIPIDYGIYPIYKISLDSIKKLYTSDPIAFSLSRSTEFAAIANKTDDLHIIDLVKDRAYTYKEKYISALVCSPKEQVLAVGTDDGRMSIRTMQGDTLLSIKASSNPVNAIAWKPDGTQIAVAHGREISIYQIK